jgi:hypothetical protein
MNLENQEGKNSNALKVEALNTLALSATASAEPMTSEALEVAAATLYATQEWGQVVNYLKADASAMAYVSGSRWIRSPSFDRTAAGTGNSVGAGLQQGGRSQLEAFTAILTGSSQLRW